MNTDEFEASLRNSAPPQNVSASLKALWFDGSGDWEKAHDIVQDLEDRESAWIHAYLHRKEGDIFNADYWYRRAGRTRPDEPLASEWKSIVSAMLMDP